MAWILPRLRQGPVVPDVAMVGETVVDKAKLALLDILLDRVQLLRRVDLTSVQGECKLNHVSMLTVFIQSDAALD